MDDKKGLMKYIPDLLNVSNMKFTNEDYKDMLKKSGGIFMLGLIYSFLQTLSRKNVTELECFKDDVEALHYDTHILNAFRNLQGFRDMKLSKKSSKFREPKYLFSSAIQNIDRLLFLENVLLGGEFDEYQNDTAIALTYFRIAKRNLEELQQIIEIEYGIKYAYAAGVNIKKIETQAFIHLSNIYRKNEGDQSIEGLLQRIGN